MQLQYMRINDASDAIDLPALVKSSAFYKQYRSTDDNKNTKRMFE